MESQNPIQLPSLRRLWKVTVVDNLEKPTVRTVLLVRKCPTLFAAMNDVKKFDGWKMFHEQYPKAEVSAVEFAGRTEN